MKEIIRQLEHTIEYFKDAQTDFQRGRVFEAEKILQALRIQDVVGRSKQIKWHHQYMNGGTLQGKAMKKCLKCGDYVKAL